VHHLLISRRSQSYCTVHSWDEPRRVRTSTEGSGRRRPKDWLYCRGHVRRLLGVGASSEYCGRHTGWDYPSRLDTSWCAIWKRFGFCGTKI